MHPPAGAAESGRQWCIVQAPRTGAGPGVGRAEPAEHLGEGLPVPVSLRCLVVTFGGDQDTLEGLGLLRSPNPIRGHREAPVTGPGEPRVKRAGRAPWCLCGPGLRTRSCPRWVGSQLAARASPQAGGVSPCRPSFLLRFPSSVHRLLPTASPSWELGSDLGVVTTEDPGPVLRAPMFTWGRGPKPCVITA